MCVPTFNDICACHNLKWDFARMQARSKSFIKKIKKINWNDT